MDVLLLIAALAVVVWLVSMPLRPGHGARQAASEAAERADLEAAKEAKLREIRDLELDWRTGKLAREDYRELDRSLRAEAIAILRSLDALEGR